jgi:hypothetical protein
LADEWALLPKVNDSSSSLAFNVDG